MKAPDVRAGEEGCRVSCAAYIEVRRVSAVDSAEITQSQGGSRALARMNDSLNAEQRVSRAVIGFSNGMGRWTRGRQQFDPRQETEFRDLSDARLRGEVGRVPCGQQPGLKLEISDRSEGCGSGDGWSARVGIRRLRSEERRVGQG